MSFLVGVILLTLVTALACALPGVFVVLRGNSMLVDAISHAILPGIVIGYLMTADLGSPVLVAGAAVAGLVVVLGSEALSRTGLIAGDAPQGLIFPTLFSVGVILVSLQLPNVHLDVHAVLVGDLNLAAFAQLSVAGVEIGPRSLFLMLGVLAVNATFVVLLYPRLTLATFDPSYAATLGLRPGLVNAVSMLLVSLTVTAAFHAVGAILVLALVIVPAATALLVSRRLSRVIMCALGFACVGSLGGFAVAYVLDAATSAGIAVTMGVLFLAVLGVQLLRKRKRHQNVMRDVARPGTVESREETPALQP